MTEWEVVSSFLNVLESNPPADQFEDWWQELWQPIQSACQNVAKHSYVMKTALKQFQEQMPGKTFAEAFQEDAEERHLVLLCEEVGLDSDELLALAWDRHKNDCRKTFRHQR